MHLRGRSLAALQVAAGLLVVWIVLFIWMWAGMWSLQPDRYADASAWWRHYALPRAAQTLLPAVVLGAVTGILVGTAVRRQTQVPARKQPGEAVPLDSGQ